MQLTNRFFKMIALAAPLLLGACEGTMQRIADCKVGDWHAIGHKDGASGLHQNFADRQDFCANYESRTAKVDPSATYLAGWTMGNWDYWAGLGREDGRKALPLVQFDRRAGDNDAKKNKTPLNRPAYEAGWTSGNAEYWEGIGKRDGTAGTPLAARDAARSAAASQNIRFNDAAYDQGWQTGNQTFWEDAGFQDARNGVPDSAFKARAATARAAGVRVQDKAYHAAWNGEIVNYWANLGTADAVSGKDFALRKREAQQKGLKIFEKEYRQAWENRLTDYWRQAGHDDGFGKPFRLEERIANATRDGVFVLARTRELYTAAWDAENARYCDPENAFALGRSNAGMAVDVCRSQLQGVMKRAYLSGQDFEAIGAKRAEAAAETSDLGYRQREIRQRLNRLEREIRSNLDNKERVVNEETTRQDKRREQDRRELISQAERVERRLHESRRREDRFESEMQRIRREIY